MLWSGGVPGNKGGGRPKNIAYEHLEQGLVAGSKLIRKLLEDALKDESKLTPDQIAKLADACARYTIGEKKVVEVDSAKFAPCAFNAFRKTCEQFGIPCTDELLKAYGSHIDEELQGL